MSHLLRLTVAPEDVDELQHVNNLVYLRWVQEAAVAHSAAVGLGLAEYRALGAVFVVRRHEIDYLRSLAVGDEVEVETRVVAISAASSERRTTIRKKGGEVAARAVTKWAFIDVGGGRPARIPDEVRRRFPLEPDKPQR